MQSIYEAFFTAASQALESVKSLGIPKEQSFILFGHKSGTIAYQRFKNTGAADSAFAVFTAAVSDSSPDRCEKAGFYMREYFPAYVSETAQYETVSGTGLLDVTGPSTIGNFHAAVNQILQLAQTGDRVLFNYAGNVYHSTNWNLMTGNGTLSQNDLQRVARQFNERGIEFHANIMSCFAGGFTQLTHNNSTRSALTCTTAATDPEIIYHGSIAPIMTQRYDIAFMRNWVQTGDQLGSYACAMGSDTINLPESSLDAITSAWEKAAGLASDEALLSPMSSLADKDLSDIISVTPEKERKSLLSEYNSVVVLNMKQCSNAIEVKTGTELHSCIDTPEFISALGREIAPDSALRDYYRNPLTRTEKGSPIDRVNRHVRLIRQADKQTLDKFRLAFCCLGTSFKTGTRPAVCTQ